MYENAWLQWIDIPAPAVGQTTLYTVPGETYMGLKSARATLVASGAVANRLPGLAVLNGDGSPVFAVVSPTAVTAGVTRRTYWNADAGGVVTSGSGDEVLPFADTLWPPGFQFRFTVAAIDAADQLSALGIYVYRVPSRLWAPSPGSAPTE